MTSETMIRDRRSAMLAAVIGTVLASYAGSAAAKKTPAARKTRK